VNRAYAFLDAIGRIGARLWGWLRGAPAHDGLYRIERIDDEPENPAPCTLYVIEDAGRAWAAAMACPGGCGQILHMNLIPDTKPVWRLTEHSDRTASLSPSVWRREGCGCHFWVRHGRIEWC
jgi:hypothetical protein